MVFPAPSFEENIAPDEVADSTLVASILTVLQEKPLRTDALYHVLNKQRPVPFAEFHLAVSFLLTQQKINLDEDVCLHLS